MSIKRKGAAEPIAAVNRITIKDNQEPLVDITTACPGIIILEPPQWLRQRVADMLKVVQSLLPEGHHLRIRIGWRSMEFQKKIYRRVYKMFRKEHPEWPENILRRQTNRFVAPPDAKAPPGHSTGAAVDLTIVGPSAEELDMISPFADFRDGGYDTFSEKVTPQARKNRKLLYTAMLKAGFSNCAAEWWHYSYGDSAWAVRTGRKSCCYGYIEPPGYRKTRAARR